MRIVVVGSIHAHDDDTHMHACAHTDDQLSLGRAKRAETGGDDLVDFRPAMRRVRVAHAHTLPTRLAGGSRMPSSLHEASLARRPACV